MQETSEEPKGRNHTNNFANIRSLQDKATRSQLVVLFTTQTKGQTKENKRTWNSSIIIFILHLVFKQSILCHLTRRDIALETPALKDLYGDWGRYDIICGLWRSIQRKAS